MVSSLEGLSIRGRENQSLLHRMSLPTKDKLSTSGTLFCRSNKEHIQSPYLLMDALGSLIKHKESVMASQSIENGLVSNQCLT